jgi:hypothetical protein
MYYGQIQEI